MKKDLFEKKEEQTISKHNIFENYVENSISQKLFKATAKPPRIVYDDRGLVSQAADGSIIKRFDKTPYPLKPTDVICPHFLELKWAYGCPFDCSWCYLKGTFRFRPEGIKPAYKDLEKVRLHVETFLHEIKIPEILNTGEIADSLMGENGDYPFSKFNRYNYHNIALCKETKAMWEKLGMDWKRIRCNCVW